METATIEQNTAIGVNAAKYSFLIGTALLIIYCTTKYEPLIPLGLLYVILAMIVNSIMLLIMLIMIIIYPKYYHKLLKTAAIILLNLPIAYLYFWIVTELA